MFSRLCFTTWVRWSYPNCMPYCTWWPHIVPGSPRGSSIMINWSVPAVFQWDLVYFINMSQQSSCHIQGSVLLSHTNWWYTISDTWKVQYRGRYHGWEYREVFPPTTDTHQSSDSPTVGRWRGPRYHYQQFEHIRSAALSCSIRKMEEYLVCASELLKGWRADTSNGLLERHLQIFSCGEFVSGLMWLRWSMVARTVSRIYISCLRRWRDIHVLGAHNECAWFVHDPLTFGYNVMTKSNSYWRPYCFFELLRPQWPPTLAP